MRHTELFKVLIDILFYTLCLGLLVILFFGPLGLNSIAQENNFVQEWDAISWLILVISILSYILLIIGVKYLKNVAGIMTKNIGFSPSVQINLKKSGKSLIFSSLLNYLTYALVFVKQLILNVPVEIIFDNNLLLQVFITIVGLYFIIQSDILKMTYNIKTENDLTI
ncbi:MAG: DUF2975 domain-containing protein [Maribacter dokdonensis]|uniref:DUF2975 domain-containing protein n=1 Tax=Maribacter dokdonensis TaxID=320912 RepID=UPI00328B2593